LRHKWEYTVSVVPLSILGVAIALIYFVYRATRKWSASVLWFFAAGISFLGSSGVVAEELWGPQWSWNVGHHGRGYAGITLAEGVCFLCVGLYSRRSRRRNTA
jgi:hypothetical protein